MSDDVVSAEEAEKELAHVQDMIGAEGVAAYPWYVRERLARTVVTLHRELAVLRAQLPPLLAVHDALREAAELPGAGASPEEMVAAVREKGAWEMREAAIKACRQVEEYHGVDVERRGWPAQVGAGDCRVKIAALLPFSAEVSRG